MGIKFGNHLFSEPEPLNSWTPPYKAGLYVILVYDVKCSPRPYRPLYFGESGNMSDRGFSTHHKLLTWTFVAGGLSNLYVATCFLPYSTSTQRCAIESDLIQNYSPICNG